MIMSPDEKIPPESQTLKGATSIAMSAPNDNRFSDKFIPQKNQPGSLVVDENGNTTLGGKELSNTQREMLTRGKTENKSLLDN
jgi:hypothetical protein